MGGLIFLSHLTRNSQVVAKEVVYKQIVSGDPIYSNVLNIHAVQDLQLEHVHQVLYVVNVNRSQRLLAVALQVAEAALDHRHQFGGREDHDRIIGLCIRVAFAQILHDVRIESAYVRFTHSIRRQRQLMCMLCVVHCLAALAKDQLT